MAVGWPLIIYKFWHIRMDEHVHDGSSYGSSTMQKSILCHLKNKDTENINPPRHFTGAGELSLDAKSLFTKLSPTKFCLNVIRTPTGKAY
ncbi:hypothetical protein YC2023_095648 [Brassica napus]